MLRSPFIALRLRALRSLVSQIGNIQSVILTGMTIPDLSEIAVNAAWQGSIFLWSAGMEIGICISLLCKGIDVSRADGLRLQEARCLTARGVIFNEYYSDVKTTNGRDDITQAIILLRQLDEPSDLAQAMIDLAEIEILSCQYEEAGHLLANCHNLLRQSSTPTRLSHRIKNAYLWQQQGKPRKALNSLEKLLGDPELSPLIQMRRRAFRIMAFAYLTRGQLSKALEAF